MYYNVVKRTVKNNDYAGVVKVFPCYGRDDLFIRKKADVYCNIRNISRLYQNKYYYAVEFDFE